MEAKIRMQIRTNTSSMYLYLFVSNTNRICACKTADVDFIFPSSCCLRCPLPVFHNKGFKAFIIPNLLQFTTFFMIKFKGVLSTHVVHTTHFTSVEAYWQPRKNWFNCIMLQQHQRNAAGFTVHAWFGGQHFWQWSLLENQTGPPLSSKASRQNRKKI